MSWVFKSYRTSQKKKKKKGSEKQIQMIWHRAMKGKETDTVYLDFSLDGESKAWVPD